MNTPAQRGDWMQTYTGRQFWPLAPRAHDIDIVDIAHSLSQQCRYAGHCNKFYSVAEHSVLLARHIEARKFNPLICMWALLHDASEAYLVDVPRPVKPYLPGYKEAEENVMAAVVNHFGLSPARIPSAVHLADRQILADEMAQNMSTPPAPWNVGPALSIKLQFWTPEKAKKHFLTTYERIEAKVKR